MLSAEANDLCEADKKKTITPGHILRAMEKLGLERYQKDVQEDFAKHKEDEKLHTKGKHGGWSSMKASGVTDEELLRQCVGLILASWFSCVSLVWSSVVGRG
ncbi:hypothetical protein I4F81_012154 [Pyropia yezoensis]|uniref:Uncharacterized protein n=1 Tax=Pyropia yezoensis TaxID=2788 RepID=A0ACC3CHK2_PYRYE|nr:hypothetical protein I4F81_012154 [Neopyropia yezoensis]